MKLSYSKKWVGYFSFFSPSFPIIILFFSMSVRLQESARWRKKKNNIANCRSSVHLKWIFGVFPTANICTKYWIFWLRKCAKSVHAGKYVTCANTECWILRSLKRIPYWQREWYDGLLTCQLMLVSASILTCTWLRRPLYWGFNVAVCGSCVINCRLCHLFANDSLKSSRRQRRGALKNVIS